MAKMGRAVDLKAIAALYISLELLIIRVRKKLENISLSMLWHKKGECEYF
jgi:hypothetical protein